MFAAFHRMIRSERKILDQRAGDLESVYTLLRNLETLELDRITSELLLVQDGVQLRVERATSLLHIDESRTGLKISVPRDEKAQSACFNGKLPRLLCQQIMTDPTTLTSEIVQSEAINAIQSVLNVDPMSLPVVLDEYGIDSIDLPRP